MTLTISIPTMDPTDLLEMDPFNRPKQYRIHLLMDQEGVVTVETFSPGQGTPADIWHGRTITFLLPDHVNASFIESVIREHYLSRLQIIHDAGTTEWDGHNWIGTWKEGTDIDEMNDLMSDLCNDLEAGLHFPLLEGGLWDAGDFFSGCDYPEDLTIYSDDDEIEKIAEELEEQAKDDGYVIYDTIQYLRGVRDELIDRHNRGEDECADPSE